ncbi:MAG: hypothetical protein ACYC5N_08180 [Endomicrobiales bacterium]
MRRGRLRRLACLLFGCSFVPVEVWSAPSARLVLLCTRCLDSKIINPTPELADQIAREHTQRAARSYAPHLN